VEMMMGVRDKTEEQKKLILDAKGKVEVGR
jgi:hypothetical protein